MHIASSKKPAGRGHTLCDILEKVKLQTVRRAVCVRNWGRRRDVDFQGGEPSVDLVTAAASHYTLVTPTELHCPERTPARTVGFSQ